MADENTVGGISVDVVANLGPYASIMGQVKAIAADTDKAATASMDHMAKAGDNLTETARKQVQQLQAAGATAQQAAKIFGDSAQGQEKLAAFTGQATAAMTAQTKVIELDTVAARANASALMEMGKSTQAASSAVQVDATARRNATAVMELEKGAVVATTSAHVSSRAALEALVLVHEALSGNFHRMAGSLAIEAQALAGAERTTNFLRAALTPMGLTIAGVTAATIAGAAAFIAYEKGQHDIMVNAAGLGAASGVSPAQVNQASGQGLGNFKNSISDNAKGIQAFSAAGVQDIGVMRELNSTTADFAVLTGQKAKDAVKELAEDMKDPVKGADDLNAKLSILDGTQLRNIRTLTEMGDKMAAQAIITDALRQRTEEADKATGGLESIFHKVGAAASDAATGIGHLIEQEVKWGAVAVKTATGNPFALGDQLAADRERVEAQARLQRDAQNRSLSAAGESLSAATPEGQSENARDKLAGDVGKIKLAIQADTEIRGAHSDAVKRDTEALAEYNRALTSYLTPAEKAHQLAQLSAEEAKARAGHNQKAAGDLAARRSVVESSGQVMSQAEVEQRASDARTGAVDRTRAPKDTFGTKDNTLSAQVEGQLALADAYGKSDAAAMKAEASLKALTDAAGHHRTEVQADKIAQDELNLGAAKAAADTAKRVADMQAETAAREKADGQVAQGLITRKQADEQVKEELALRPIEAALANSSLKAHDALAAVLERETKAQADRNAEVSKAIAIDSIARDADEIAVNKLKTSMVGQPRAKQDVAVARLQRTQQLGPDTATTPAGQTAVQTAGDAAASRATLEQAEQFRAMTLEVQKQTDALQKQQATMGMTLEQADKYTTEQKLLLEAERDGIELTDGVRASIDKLADSYAKASDSARKLAASEKGRQQAAKTVGDTVEGGLEGVLFDGVKPEDAARSAAKSLGKDAFKATMTGEGPLAGLFGTDQTSTVGGSNGGILSSLTGALFGTNKSGGGQKPTGTANDPLFVTTAGGSGGGAGGGGIMGMVKSLFGGGGGGGGGLLGGLGGAPGDDAGGALSEMAGLFHTGTSYVGTPSRMVQAPPKLFLNAPRLHQGLAPDEFPAILQRGERVTPKNGRQSGGGHTTIMNISTNDASSFGRSQRQIQRRQKQAMGRPA